MALNNSNVRPVHPGRHSRAGHVDQVLMTSSLLASLTLEYGRRTMVLRSEIPALNSEAPQFTNHAYGIR
jgi:hypothetical protein